MELISNVIKQLSCLPGQVRLRSQSPEGEKLDGDSSSFRISFINAHLVGHGVGKFTVVVEDGKIKSIGNDLQHSGEVVDLRGQWLAPSLIDWHIHSKLTALQDRRFDLQTAVSARQALSITSQALANPKYDRTELVGLNMRNGSWTDDHLMSRDSLDSLSLDRPIYLMYNGYHSMCCNSAGLRRIGIDPTGHDGMLKEEAAFEASKKLSEVEDTIMDEWVMESGKRAARLGVTEIVDLEMDWNLRDWERRFKTGFHHLRVHAGLYDTHLEEAISRDIKTGDIVPNTQDLLKVGPYKVITDGGLGSQTAFCHDPYPGTHDHGIFVFPQRTLAEMLQRGVEYGFKLAVHAIGDHANRIVLQTMADLPIAPPPGSTIEHAQLLNLSDIPYFKDMGLIASVQPAHLVDDRETCLKYWPGREGRAWALKSLVDAGVALKFGSDSPVATLNPWEAMAVAMSRSGQGKEPLSPEQGISVDTAWISSTSNGKAGLEVGDEADLVILSHDPLKSDAEGLRSMEVHGTMLAGRWTHREE